MKYIGQTTAALAVALSGAAHATTIDFESDAVGPVNNGFVSVDSDIASFSDTSGADLQLADFGVQSDGRGLAVFDDDDSQLQIDFTRGVRDLKLTFGNDDPSATTEPLLAVFRGFFNGQFVAQSTVVANRDDVANQTITLGETKVDQAIFWYANLDGSVADLAEIVDNIEFTVVPLPAGMPLILTGLGGMYVLRRRGKESQSV